MQNNEVEMGDVRSKVSAIEGKIQQQQIPLPLVSGRRTIPNINRSSTIQLVNNSPPPPHLREDPLSDVFGSEGISYVSHSREKKQEVVSPPLAPPPEPSSSSEQTPAPAPAPAPAPLASSKQARRLSSGDESDNTYTYRSPYSWKRSSASYSSDLDSDSYDSWGEEDNRSSSENLQSSPRASPRASAQPSAPPKTPAPKPPETPSLWSRFITWLLPFFSHDLSYSKSIILFGIGVIGSILMTIGLTTKNQSEDKNLKKTNKLSKKAARRNSFSTAVIGIWLLLLCIFAVITLI